jgi:hypothetical protein
MSMRYVGRGFEVVVVMALLPNGNIAVCDAERASEDPLVSTDGARRFEVAIQFPEKEITRVDAK